jgi:carboxymethylenebutenolidase
MTAATQIHCAELDGAFPPAAAEELLATLRGLGREVELHVYPGTTHAFANEDRPEVFDEASAALLFDRSVTFLRTHLA